MRGTVMRWMGFVLLAPLVSVAATAAETPGARAKATADKPNIIFHNYCSVCHGEKGDGKSLARFALVPPPADFTSDEVRKGLSRAHMIEVLHKGTRTKEGKPTAMVAWPRQLSRQQIEAVVDYVIVNFMAGKVAPNDQTQAEGHKHEGHDHSAVSVKPVDYPYGLKPDAAHGKTIYAAQCAQCHGVKGDGRGNPALTGRHQPRNFKAPDYRAFATGFTLFSAISRGSGHMPGWSAKLSQQDIADVAEHVLRSYVRTQGTAAPRK